MGPTIPKVARTVDSLGNVLRELGELPKAEACKHRAQAIRERLNPSD
jgi:hypothetical protein